jgi:hypothetical protein
MLLAGVAGLAGPMMRGRRDSRTHQAIGPRASSIDRNLRVDRTLQGFIASSSR